MKKMLLSFVSILCLEFVSVAQCDDFVVTVMVSNPTCYQFSDGSITLNVTGGNGGNVFEILNISGTQLNVANSNTANNLPGGWYYWYVEDVVGCAHSDSLFIDQPGELAIDLILEDALCFGDSTGMAVVDTVWNYNGNYNDIAYFWNPNPSGINGSGATSCDDLYAGDYTLTINDENGCSKQFDFTIGSPSEMYFDHLMVSHYSSTVYGSVSASASGGTSPYDYLWTNLSTMATSINSTWGGLLPGDYQIEITDANGCVLTAIVSIGYLTISDNNEAEFIQVYPTLLNGDQLNVSNQNQSATSLLIYDLQGKKVFEKPLVFGDNTVSIVLSSGSYVYHVMDATGILQEGKIVVAE